MSEELVRWIVLTEECEICSKAPEIDSTTAEPICQRPRTDVGNELEAGVDEIELKREVGVDSSLWR